MIKYYRRIFFFNVRETWFTYQYKFADIFSLNSFLHLKNFENKKIPAIQVNSHTLELDLEQDLGVILANFSKQIRQQTKIAENEGTTCYFHQEIDQFVSFFNDFAVKFPSCQYFVCSKLAQAKLEIDTRQF